MRSKFSVGFRGSGRVGKRPGRPLYTWRTFRELGDQHRKKSQHRFSISEVGCMLPNRKSFRFVRAGEAKLRVWPQDDLTSEAGF